jgi:hypothetical protein
MRSVGTESGAAGIPAEVMKLVSGVGHVHSTNNLSVLLGFLVYVHDDQRVGLSTTVRIQSCHVCKLFSGCTAGEFGRRIKSRVGLPQH